MLEYGAKIEYRNELGDTSFHVAAAHGQIRLLKFYFQKDIQVHMLGKNKFTALHSAAENGQPATCKTLILEGGLSTEARSSKGDTPLHVAAFMGETGVMKMLLSLGAKTELLNNLLETPLHRCCASGKVDALVLLSQRKANLEARQKYGWTLMHTAASNGHEEMVKALVGLRGDLNAQDFNGNTPLHIAAFYGKSGVVQILINRQCEKEKVDAQGRTALHHAAWGGMRPKFISNPLLAQSGNRKQSNFQDNSCKPVWFGFRRDGLAMCSIWKNKINETGVWTARQADMVPNNSNTIKVLLLGKLNVLANDLNGYTPIQCAATTGQTESCKVLMKAGARLNDKGEHGRSLLHLVACGCGSPSVANFFLERNVRVDVHDKYGETPLSLACRFGKLELAIFLIKKGASVDGSSSKCDSPIHRAAERGHVDVAKMLLSLNIDKRKVVNVNALNSQGDTPLTKAAAAGQMSTTWLLLSSGADVNFANAHTGKTAIILAAENGHHDVCRLLCDNKADISVADNKGKTPLIAAASFGCVEICRMFVLEYDADVKAVDLLGRNALHWAVACGKAACFEYFLRETILSVTDVDENGDTVFHIGCRRSNFNEDEIAIVKMLADEQLTGLVLAKAFRTRNKNGEIAISLLKQSGFKRDKRTSELFQFISSKLMSATV